MRKKQLKKPLKVLENSKSIDKNEPNTYEIYTKMNTLYKTNSEMKKHYLKLPYPDLIERYDITEELIS